MLTLENEIILSKPFKCWKFREEERSSSFHSFLSFVISTDPIFKLFEQLKLRTRGLQQAKGKERKD